MSCLSKNKKVLWFGLFLISLFHLSSLILAEEHAAENKRVKLVSEIKEGLKELEQTQKDLSSKFPLIKKFELKERILSVLGDFFKGIKYLKYYNDYVHTLTPSQLNDFSEYQKLLNKKMMSELMSNNNIIEMMESLEMHSSGREDCLKLTTFYGSAKEKFSDSEENKCRMFQEKLNIPNDFKDYLIATKFQGTYSFYFAVLKVINDPIDQKRIKINPLLSELTTYNKSESDKKVQNEIDDFIKRSRETLSTPNIAIPNIGSQDYYRIKLFSECMQSPEKKDAIKKVLQESRLMRKAIFSVIIGDQYGNVGYVKKIADKIDYDNFDQYWRLLEEKSEELVESLFSNEIRKKLEEAPGAASRKMMAQCYLECFFTPYLVLDNQ